MVRGIEGQGIAEDAGEEQASACKVRTEGAAPGRVRQLERGDVVLELEDGSEDFRLPRVAD